MIVVEDVRRDLLAMQAQDGGQLYRDLIDKLYGIEYSRSIVSTAEHLAPFNHSETVSFLLPQQALSNVMEDSVPITVFGASLVPLDNYDYPRGIFLPSKSYDGRRQNFASQRYRKRSAIGLPAPKNLQPLKCNLSNSLIAGVIDNEQETFADFLSDLMMALVERWPFESKSRTRVIPLEIVASRILEQLIADNDSIVRTILFEPEAQAYLRNQLNGVFCAWGEGHGSFLFWRLKKGKVYPFELSNGYLVSDEYTVELEPESILTELRAGSIVPGVFLALFCISWLPNKPINGGPKQYYYWRRMIATINNLVSYELRRLPTLSVHGYNRFHIGSVLEKFKIMPFGTGLNLIDRTIDAKNFLEQIGKSPLVEPIDVVYCD